MQGLNPAGVIVVSGSIEADETTISPKVSGKLAKLFVDEGTTVTKGQLLAELDPTELAAQLGEDQAALAAAQAKLDEAIAGNRPQQITQAQAELRAAENTRIGQEQGVVTAKTNLLKVTDLKAQVDAAQARKDASEAAYRQALQALRLLRAGTRPQQIDEARAALGQATVAETKAVSDWTRAKMLIDQGAISSQNFDEYTASRDGAIKARSQAEAHLADLVAGPRPEELREAEQQVSQTKADLDGSQTALANAQTEYSDRLSAQNQMISAASGAKVAAAQTDAAAANLNLLQAGSREEDIRSARATRDEAQKTVEYAQDLVADTKLFAPADGVIQTKSALPGEMLNPGTPVVSLVDLDHIWIRVYVPEDQYGKLSLGQPVDVTVDSFPKRKFHGQIASISSEFEFTPKNAQTPEERVKLVFGVKVFVENPGRELKPGMPGDATLRLH